MPGPQCWSARDGARRADDEERARDRLLGVEAEDVDEERHGQDRAAAAEEAERDPDRDRSARREGAHALVTSAIAIIGAHPHVEGDLQVGDAVRLGLGQLAGADVDLDRRQDQGRGLEARVALLAEGDVLASGSCARSAGRCRASARRTVRLEGERPAARQVVVAHEEARLVGQRVEALDRVVELARPSRRGSRSARSRSRA